MPPSVTPRLASQLQIDLPVRPGREVDADSVSAKFRKKKEALKVIIPTKPAPEGTPAGTETAAAQGPGNEAGDEAEDEEQAGLAPDEGELEEESWEDAEEEDREEAEAACEGRNHANAFDVAALGDVLVHRVTPTSDVSLTTSQAGKSRPYCRSGLLPAPNRPSPTCS